MGHSHLKFVIAADPPPRLDKALARDVPEAAALSRTRLARLITDGAVTIGGQVETNPKAKACEGQQVQITIAQAATTHIAPEPIPLNVVHEDADLIVINKPAGMVVHPAPGTPEGTLVNALLHHCGDSLSGVGGVARPGVVHRIDKDTSGLLVVAKTDAAHHGLSAQFAQHSVERKYMALAHGVPMAGDPRLRGQRGIKFETGNVMKIQTELARHKHDRQRQAVLFDGGRHAVTRCRVLESFGQPPVLSLLECWLETGRTHQIRVHMAYAGHGLVGDPVYGGRRKISSRALSSEAITALNGFDRQALHAAVLGFQHPVAEVFMRFEAPMPDDMASLIAKVAS